MERGRIVTDPEVCGGNPRIAGTRIRVSLVLEILASSGNIDEVLEMYTHITREDILSCLKYAHQVVDEVEVSSVGRANC